MHVCVEVLMFLGIRVHLYMGCVAQRHDFIGADALNFFCCSVIARPEKKNGDFRAPQNGRAGGREPKKKKGFP